MSNDYLTQPIEDYPDYFVTSCGRIISTKTGHPRFLSTVLNKSGYSFVMVFKNKKPKRFSVHSLVAAAFIGKRPKGLVINHIDGDKSNNDVINLEYVSNADNVRHAFKLGLVDTTKGEKHSQSKLTESEVIDIVELLKNSNLRYSDIAECFNVTSTNITSINIGRTWQHITSKVVDSYPIVKRRKIYRDFN